MVLRHQTSIFLPLACAENAINTSSAGNARHLRGMYARFVPIRDASGSMGDSAGTGWDQQDFARKGERRKTKRFG